MQKPHCTPPSRTNASLRTRRVSSGRPSTVTTSRPSICSGLRRHDNAGVPSTSTRQQPHVAFRRAAVFRRHDAAFLAQDLEEMHPRLVRGDDRFPV